MVQPASPAQHRHQGGHTGNMPAPPARPPALLPEGVVPTDDSVYEAIHDYTLYHRQPVPQGCQSDSVKLFVGNLPKCFSEEMLRPVFEHFGVVAGICVMKDRHTRESKGSAFLWYSSLQEAASAIRELHAQCHLPDGASGVSSRALIVRPATFSRGRPQEPHEVLAGSLLSTSLGTPYPGLDAGSHLPRCEPAPLQSGGHAGLHAQDYRPSEAAHYGAATNAGAHFGALPAQHFGSPRPRRGHQHTGRGRHHLSRLSLPCSTGPGHAPPPPHAGAGPPYNSALEAGWLNTWPGGPHQALLDGDAFAHGPPPGLRSGQAPQPLDLYGSGLAGGAALSAAPPQGSPNEAVSPSSRRAAGGRRHSKAGPAAVTGSHRVSSLPTTLQLQEHFDALHTSGADSLDTLHMSLSAGPTLGNIDGDNPAVWPTSAALAAGTNAVCPQRTASWVHSGLEAALAPGGAAHHLQEDASAKGRVEPLLTPEAAKDLLTRFDIPAECTASPEAEAATLRLLLHLTGQVLAPAGAPADRQPGP